MLTRILNLLFPPKCIFCGSILSKEETDLCRQCRTRVQEFSKAKRNISFVAQWCAVWYYSDEVRKSILRYKFYNARSYALVYGRFLAMQLQKQMTDSWDILTYVPISPLRRFIRGYDQVQLLTEAVARELGVAPVCTLKKIRHTRAQSGIRDAAKRRANILGAYRVTDPSLIAGKRILLLDDVITTGATVSECAKTLLIQGAKEVRCAAVAAVQYHNK